MEGLFGGAWLRAPGSVVTADDVSAWPYSVGVLVKWGSFLGTLGAGGVFFVELLYFL